MHRVRVAAIGLVLVVPLTASAQPAAFVQGVHSLAQAAIRRDTNDVAVATGQLSAALAEWDRQLRVQELQVAHDLASASAEQRYRLHLDLGVVYRTRGRLDAALREFDAAATLHPAAPRVQQLRGLTLDLLGRSTEATHAFQLAWSNDTDNPIAAYYALQSAPVAADAAAPALKTLTNTYDRLRTMTPASATPPFDVLDALPDTLANVPVVGDARTGTGFALLAARHYAEAVASLSSVGGTAAGTIDGPLGHFIRAQADEKENRVSDARAEYTASLDGALAGRSAIWVAIGRLAQVEGDVSAAIDAFTRAVRLNPNEPLLRQELAGAYTAAGRGDAAFAELVAGLLINPGYAPLHAAIGQLRLDTDHPLDAIPAFTRALELSPERYEVRYALAVAFKRAGKADEAARELEQYERARRQIQERRRQDIQADVDKEDAIRRGLPPNPGGTP